ncbi:MAG TPA: VWA domain-containing protein, partial [bacterium]|nr:VWA domain-containing protein [bacterium]
MESIGNSGPSTAPVREETQGETFKLNIDFIKFDSPVFLLIAALVAVTALLYRKRDSYPSAQTQWPAVLRFITIGLILTGLAGPQFLKLTNNKCILFIVDISQSIHEKEKEAVRNYIRLKIEEKGKDDRVGVLLFAEEADLVIPPSGLSMDLLLSEASRLMESHEAGRGFTDIESALSAAVKLFPEGFQKKIVLITDGNENTGEASRLFDDLKSMSITVDVLPVGGVNHDEVLVESLHAPFEVRAGSPFTLEAALSSNTETTGSLQLIVDGQEKGFLKDQFKIVPGHHQIYRFPVVIEKSGLHDISVKLRAEQDGFFINNRAETVIFAAARPKVLFITDPASNNPRGPLKHLGRLLTDNSIDVEYLPADLLPAVSK